MGIVLAIIAVLLGIYGLVKLIEGQLLVGVGCIIAAFLIGPGGISIFH